ncbi:MAG: B12-binding domain-containing protein [Ignavibacteriae bacterium]|nr:B12-binding domain-containing protein [Ignavibacteriota bacterium]
MKHFSTTTERVVEAIADTAPVDERLQRRIVDGDAIGLQTDLDEALRQYPAIDIINTILLGGMKIVGELFGSGQMQLPFVLQSAETMKAAVAYLEQFMDKVDGIHKGTLVLATVKGDVHDIGKNLVDIILSNNGYKVINLGIKVPVETMLNAVEEHKADAIGMSGLLVKSTVIMKENLELMRHRGMQIPVVLGGAALTRRFVEQDLRAVYDGDVAYANDAFDGLAFMERVISGESAATQPRVHQEAVLSGTEAKVAEASVHAQDVRRESFVRRDVQVPVPPFFGSRVVRDISLDHVFEFINEVALIRGQWQVRRGALTESDYEALLQKEIRPALERVKDQARKDAVLEPALVYGYFPCWSEGNDLVVGRPIDTDESGLHTTWLKTVYARDELVEWQRFQFPRQTSDRHLCIADYFTPGESGNTDVCAFHLVTMGSHASEYTARLFADGKFQEYLYMHGLTVECAEALAEFWHKEIRRELGIGHQDAESIRRLFSQGYQGSRYSFGYPACPNLEDQKQLFALLKPERIDVTLTDEWQLVPEQSTSALIVHHPDARYFTIKD